MSFLISQSYSISLAIYLFVVSLVTAVGSCLPLEVSLRLAHWMGRPLLESHCAVADAKEVGNGQDLLLPFAMPSVLELNFRGGKN